MIPKSRFCNKVTQLDWKYAAFTFPRIDIDCGWAALLLTNKKMFLLCLPVEPSRTLKSSVKIVMVILLLTQVVFDKNVYIFKAKGSDAFPTMISACLLLSSMFTHRRIVNMCLACLSLWQEWPLKVSVLSGRQLCNKPTSCFLCISLDSQLWSLMQQFPEYQCQWQGFLQLGFVD